MYVCMCECVAFIKAMICAYLVGLCKWADVTMEYIRLLRTFLRCLYTAAIKGLVHIIRVKSSRANVRFDQGYFLYIFFFFCKWRKEKSVYKMIWEILRLRYCRVIFYVQEIFVFLYYVWWKSLFSLFSCFRVYGKAVVEAIFFHDWLLSLVVC